MQKLVNLVETELFYWSYLSGSAMYIIHAHIYVCSCWKEIRCMEEVEPIRGHAFFREIDWNLLDRRKLKPPFKPQVVCVSVETMLCCVKSSVYLNRPKQGASPHKKKVNKKFKKSLEILNNTYTLVVLQRSTIPKVLLRWLLG